MTATLWTRLLTRHPAARTRRGPPRPPHPRARRRPAVEVLEERTLLSGYTPPAAKWTFGNAATPDYTLASFSPADANLGALGAHDPTLNLAIGTRYTVTIADPYDHPFQVVARGTTAFSDVVLLAMGTPYVSPTEVDQTARWENDAAVGWTSDFNPQGTGPATVSFTLTPALADALTQGGRLPGYRCGNQYHRTFQRGIFDLSPGAPPAKGPDTGTTFATARPLALTSAGAGSQAGTIQVAGGQDVYSFVAPVTGQMSVTQADGPGSFLGGIVFAYDDAHNVLAFDAQAPGATAAAVTQFPVVEGRTYYVQAAGSQDSTGAYSLTVTTTPQDLSPAPGLTFLPLNDAGAGSATGTVAQPDQPQKFYVIAPVAGRMTITQRAAPGSGLDSVVSVYDHAGQLLASATDSGDGLGSQVQFNVVANQVYTIQAAGRVYYNATGVGDPVADVARSTGAFDLAVTTAAVAPAVPAGAGPDAGDSCGGPGSCCGAGNGCCCPCCQANARALALDAAGFGSATGTLDTPGDAEAYQFVAPATGDMVVTEKAAGGTALDTFLSVYAGTSSTLLASNDDANGITNSQVEFPVVAGQTYFVQAGAAGDSTGQYLLDVAFRDPPSPSPVPLALDGTDSAAVDGAIARAGDVDRYVFTPTVTGSLVVALNATGGGFDGVLHVFDPAGTLDLRDDDSGGGSNSLLTVPVVAGRTYEVDVAGFETSTGEYRLVLGNDYPGSFAGAAPVALDGSGGADLAGRIGTAGQQDFFRFTAPVLADGRTQYTLAVVESPDLGSALQTSLAVYDAGQTLVGSDNFTTQKPYSRVQLVVTAGQSYFVRAAGAGTGPFHLDFGVLDHASSLPGDSLALPADQAARTTGTVEVPFDTDTFQVVVPQTGTLGITEAPAVGSSLKTLLTVVDPSGNVLTSDNDAFGKGFSQVQLKVQQGQVLSLEVSGRGTSTGNYNLIVQWLTGNGPGLAPHNLTTGLTAADLAQALLGPGVTVSNVTYDGVSNVAVLKPPSPFATDPRTASGLFGGGTNIVGFGGGVLLTTGNAANVVGPNFTDGSSGQINGTPGSPDLNRLLPAGVTTLDAATLSFDFVPTTDQVELRYVFGSTEYSKFTGSVFDDAFGAFVNGVDYARVPGTGTGVPGTGDIISVDTLNAQVNSAYFRNNGIGPDGSPGPIDTQMNGLSQVLVMRAPVMAGKVNHMTLVIADAVDPRYDSAVFLEQGSLQAVTDSVAPVAGAQAFAGVEQQAAQLGGAADEQSNIALNRAAVKAVKDLGLVGNFLVVPVDPVDYTLTNQAGLKVSSKAGPAPGTNAFYASDGGNNFLIVPDAQAGQYRVALVGLGSGEFRFGASYVTSFGQVTTYLVQGTLADGRTEPVLDFLLGPSDGVVTVQTVDVSGPAQGGEVSDAQVVANQATAGETTTPAPAGTTRPSSAGSQGPPAFVVAATNGFAVTTVGLLTGLVTGSAAPGPVAAPGATGRTGAGVELLNSGTSAASPIPWDAVLVWIDRAFRDWLPAADARMATAIEVITTPGLDLVSGAAAELRSAWQTLAGDTLPMPELSVPGMTAALRGWILQVERLAADDVSRWLHEVLPGAPGHLPRQRLRALPRTPEPARMGAGVGFLEEGARLSADSLLALVFVSGAYQACWNEDEGEEEGYCPPK
jgi:hypothetical protein